MGQLEGNPRTRSCYWLSKTILLEFRKYFTIKITFNVAVKLSFIKNRVRPSGCRITDRHPDIEGQCGTFNEAVLTFTILASSLYSEKKILSVFLAGFVSFSIYLDSQAGGTAR